MRRIVFIAAGLACAACAAPYGPQPVPPPAPPPPSSAIHVIRRAGASYPTTTTETLGVLRLLPCTTGATAAPGTDIIDPTTPNVARNGAGDELRVPANAAARGTRISVNRRAGAYRSVEAYSSTRPASAQVVIGVDGCGDLTGKNPTVVRQLTDDIWEDVGGTVSGSGASARITTPMLTHLSIYALAGGN